MEILYLLVLFGVFAALGWVKLPFGSRQKVRASDSMDWELEQRAMREERRR